MSESKEIRNLLRLLVAIVFVSLAIISWSTILTVRTSRDARDASKNNTQFLGNFSNYMRCLVVNDDEVVLAYGLEEYFNLCDELLFRGTGVDHEKIIVTVPTTGPTPSTQPGSATTVTGHTTTTTGG